MLKMTKLLSCILCFLILGISSTCLPINIVLASSKTTRIYGNDRYKTSMEILNSGWETSKNLVLASGEDYPDALCSVPLAKKLSAPVLLTTKSEISNEVINKIIQLNVENLFIIGGEGSISKNVEDTLKRETNVNIVRLSGITRYETSMAVAKYMYSNFNMSKEIVVTSGLGFADSISVAPIAAQKDMPILLTDKYTFSANNKDFLNKNSIIKTYIIGGSGVISENVAKNYPSPERIWGIDRYETNLNIINHFNSGDINKIYVASGENFPDSLSGAALAGKDSSFIVLTPTSPNNATRSLVYNVWRKDSSTSNLIILGGTAVISDDVVKQLTTKELDFTGNIINGSLVSYNNGNTYYYNPQDDTYHQLSADNTLDKKVAETSAKSLNVIGNNVYYVKNFSNDKGIYKSDLNGSNKIKISNNAPYNIIVYDDWIYYYKDSGNEDGIYYFCRTKTDGTREEHVDLNIKSPYIANHGYPFCIKDGRIYMSITKISASPPDKPEFVMANLDGSDVKIIKEDNLSRFQPVDNWIYYSDSNGIHKIKNDGSEDTLLAAFHYTNNAIYSINVFNDYIYYTIMSFNEEDKINEGLYRMNLDGSNIIKISDEATDYLFTVPGWIYFYKNGQVLKVKIDA